jgi:hypothetical protein
MSAKRLHSHGLRRRAVGAFAIGFLASFALVDAQLIINGGNVVIQGMDIAQSTVAEPDPAGPHLIEFFDGRQLHGTMETLDLANHELTWRRKDTNVPLTISTIDVSRVNFDPTSQSPANAQMLQFGFQPDALSSETPDNKGRATVKFAGGDWLVAEVTSVLDNKIHLELAGRASLVVDRNQVEWIYFSKGPAPECFEGPTGFSGWASGGGWSYRDGMLRASSPTQIGRNLGPLPDQVEYQFEVDQGNLLCAFTFNLHGRYGMGRGGGPGMIQCMVRANTLNVYGNVGGSFRSRQLDLSKTLGSVLDGRDKPGKNNPVLFQAFEDFTGGKLLVYINHQKAGEWDLEKGESGRNAGGFSFQPTVWSSSFEQTLSKIRVVPWDGHLPDETPMEGAAAPDHLLLADGSTREGKFVDFAFGTVRLRSEGKTVETPRDQIRMVSFQHHDAPGDMPAAVARLRLKDGGEFDAASVNWRDGKLDLHTRFGIGFVLPVAAVTDLHIAQTAPALNVAADVLVFKNGDRLKGHLETAADNEKVHWRVGEAAQSIEFATTHALGVRRVGDGAPVHKRVDCVVRFRNNDWLAGKFVTIDKNDLVLDTADAGQLTLSRAQVRALYFSRDGSLPISDGASDDREWLQGGDLTGSGSTPRVPLGQANLWRNFDGAFSLANTENLAGVARAGGLHIGRQMDNLPALVEVSFDVTGSRDQILFASQLFSDPSSPGYFMQFHNQGLYIYDLNPAQRGRGIIPQQMQFEGKLKPDARQRHIDLFANRDTGMLAVFVDGVLITRFGGKAGSTARQLGHGITLSPQIGMPCTFSNLWFGPWNGRLPGQSIGVDGAPDTVMLKNGDEATGIVDLATPASAKVTSGVGPLELPLDRITMIDFGGPPAERTAGARVHLAGVGVLTVRGYRVEKDVVACRTEVAGSLCLPLEAVRELVFATPLDVPPASKKQ